MKRRKRLRPRNFVILSIAFGLMSLGAPLRAHAQTFASYVCTGAFYSFNATYSADGDSVMLELNDGQRVQLQIAVSGSGTRYTGSEYELHSKGTTAVLQLPNANQMTCSEQGSGDQVTQPIPQAPQPARPSFSCSGRLGPTEQSICGNAQIAKLDRDMSNAFYALIGRLSQSEQSRLKSDQRQWLGQRNRCGRNDSCIEREYYDRIAALNEWEAPGAPPAQPAGFPYPGQSWGGIVRSGPGTNYAKIGSLAEGTPLTILSDTGVDFNGYRWFQIRWGSRTGYQWGGIICPKGRALAGAFQVCN